MSEAGKDDWDEHWNAYSDAATSNPAQHFRFRRIADLISESTDVVGSHLIVDVGCGNGDFLQYLSQTTDGLWFLGIEPSHAGSTIAASKIGEANVRRLDLVQSSPNDTADLQADVVVCTEVLEHLDNPAELLTAMRTKITKPGTRIIVSVPGGPRSAYDRHIGHRRHFSKRRLAELLKSAGFAEVDVMRSGFPVFNIYKLAVIFMGKRLIKSPEKFVNRSDNPSRISPVITRLMNAGPRDFPMGWQLFGTAVVR